MTYYNDEIYFSYQTNFQSGKRYVVPQIGTIQRVLDEADDDEEEDAPDAE